MSPTTSRSSSTSSGSRASSKSPPDPAKRKFGCTFPGCGKAFSRSEHLHRHALNHKEGNNTCQRCSAHFRRRDLLDRHMARHKEKDDEAGGEGLGVLATRKRLWRDEHGSIVNSRRPSSTQNSAKRRQLNRPARKLSDDEGRSSLSSSSSSSSASSLLTPISHHHPSPSFSTIIVDTDNASRRPSITQLPNDALNSQPPHDSWLAPLAIDSALSSPPFLSPTLHSADQSPGAELSEFDALYEDTTWPNVHNHDSLPPLTNSHPSTSTASPILGDADLAHTTTWGAPPPPHHQHHHPFQTFMGAPMDNSNPNNDLPYDDDIFKPEPSLYEWQTWSNHALMSRCREEKTDDLTISIDHHHHQRRREWGSVSVSGDTAAAGAGLGVGYVRQDEEAFRRSFGLGTC